MLKGLFNRRKRLSNKDVKSNIVEDTTVENDEIKQPNLKKIEQSMNDENTKNLEEEDSTDESFKQTEELKTYIRQFLNNVTFPSLLLLPYFNAELSQVWLADTQGINFRQSEDIDDFYKNDFKPFILYLKNKGIIVDGFEDKFLDILISTMDDIVCERLHNEYFETLDKEETLESCILKYLELNNFDEELYDRIIHMRYLRRFLRIKNYTGEVFKESTAGIDKLTKIMEEILENYKFELKMNRFESKIESTKKNSPTIEYVDFMDGQEFEMFLMDLFQALGYKSEMTKQTGDQGVDLIISKNNQSIAVQAKRYSTTVGNSAIQQVVAGQQYYNTDKTMVVTNNYFTKSCLELAQSTNTILWDRDKLNAMMELIY